MNMDLCDTIERECRVALRLSEVLDILEQIREEIIRECEVGNEKDLWLIRDIVDLQDIIYPIIGEAIHKEMNNEQDDEDENN